MITECRKRGASRVDLLAFEFEMGLFPAVLDEAKGKEAAIAALKNGKSDVVCEQGKLIKISKDKEGIVSREVLTKHWTDWVDYWAVDFDYASKKEIIKVARSMGVEGDLPGLEPAQRDLIEFEERWTGGYIFENEWQSFRTRQNRYLELISAAQTYTKPGHTVAVKESTSSATTQ